MRISERELKVREANRAMILAGHCPNCGHKLIVREDMATKSPKYHWRECLACHMVMGVSK